jgi:hypothetical protein
VNTERLNEVALWLETGAPERHFNMNQMLGPNPNRDPLNWCGTECCIAGYVVTRYQPGSIGFDNIAHKARDLLGLNDDVADALFYPRELGSEENINSVSWDDITPAQAAQAVRNVIGLNDPCWEEILE